MATNLKIFCFCQLFQHQFSDMAILRLHGEQNITLNGLGFLYSNKTSNVLFLLACGYMVI